jgi:threonylcarbamoyladenosine tRNA methylthiotransferase MtaB
MNYSIVTFGCRVNQADSLAIEEQLLAFGARPSSADRADVLVVNTCSVTATSDQGARQTIRRIARQNPAVRIVVTGCYATRAPQDLAGLPGVVDVIENDRKEAGVAAAVFRRGLGPSLTTAERFGEGDGPCGRDVEPGVAGRTAFTLRVQTGCDEPCAYCIIPATRGSSRSRTVATVLAEVERVARAGFKELVLTGVHLGSYGRDLHADAVDLLGLLRQLDRHRADVRFRISSLEPMDCTPAIVDLVAASERFAPHFHLPLQHASDAVLRAMRRPYALADYRRLVDGIRTKLPEAAIGSDIIVGFPGETEQDAERLLAYLSGSPLTHLHVFPYSDRPGTAATTLTAKVPGGAIRERARHVRAVGAALAARFKSAQIGSVHHALTIEDGSLAVTGNYLKVRISPGTNRNEWVDVRVTGLGDPMVGEAVLAS